jgi:hypothetical protein
MIVLGIYGLGALSAVIVPPSPGVRENAGFYIASGLLLLLAAATTWRLWVRPTGSVSQTPALPAQDPASLEVLSKAVNLLEDALLPKQNTTDLLPWAWLISLDLAFRERLWVRIVTLLASILVVFIVIPVILALLYYARVLR